MEKNLKIVVAHPYQQHSYRIAEALEKYGYDYKYVTSIYRKKFSLTKYLFLFLNRENKIRAKSRSSEMINKKNVIIYCELLQLMILLTNRLCKGSKLNIKLKKIFEARFNNKLFKYIIKNKTDIIITFDTLSASIYEKLKSNNIIKILDLSAPNLKYMNEIFSKFNKSVFVNEQSEKNEKRAIYEIENSNYILVASEFSKKSLLEYVDISKIHTIPYGIETLSYSKKKLKKNNEYIFGFVGRINYKKGVHTLLKAIEQVDCENCKFIFHGELDTNDDYICKERKNVIYKKHIPKSEIMFFYDEIDFLIFPSLADGFGFAALEAMSKGVPVIISNNSGVADLIINDINGYVFNTNNHIELYEYINRIICGEINYESMSENAYNTAKKLTWDEYYKKINDIVKLIMKDKMVEL